MRTSPLAGNHGDDSLSLLQPDARLQAFSEKTSGANDLDTDDQALGKRLNSLPPEVLSEIFYWCVPTAKDQEYSSPRFALTLSQVCRHWRSVTLNTPSLWTYTKVKIIQHQLSPSSELMRLYLERSKTCPIFIDIDFVDIWMYYHPVLNLFQEVIDFVRKFRPVSLLANSYLATHLESGSNEDMATRTEWYFWAARKKDTGAPPAGNLHEETNRDSLVTLRALRLANGSFVLEPYMDWSSSLTFLEIKDLNNYTNLTVPTAVSILSAFPLLVHCSLHIDFDDTEPLLATQVTLNNLQSFALSWSEWVDCGRLLDVLSSPDLVELELTGYIPETATGGAWMHLVHFLQRNRPPLKHLILDEIDCFHISLADALLYTPQLEGLWLENCILDDDLVRSMHDDGTSITNSLLTLVFVSCYAIDLEALAEILVEVRAKRRQEGRQELIAYVDGCGMLLKEQMERLQKMDVIELGKYVPLDFIDFRSDSDSQNEVVSV